MSAEIRAEQKAALKGMGFKKKLEYFWEYYHIPFIAIVFSVALLASVIHGIATQKDYAFSAMMLNAFNLDGEELAADFAEYADLDMERYNCYIDTQSAFSLDDSSPYDMGIMQRLTTLAMAGSLDVLICYGLTFDKYAESDMFTDLRMALSEEQLAYFEDYFYYVDKAVIDERRANPPDLSLTVEPPPEYFGIADPAQYDEARIERHFAAHRDPTGMKDPMPIGIFVGDAPFIQANNSYPMYPPVYAIINGTPRMEEAVWFLEYLWKS